MEAVRAQVEELSPEQRVRVEEVKNSIDLIDSQAAVSYTHLDVYMRQHPKNVCESV